MVTSVKAINLMEIKLNEKCYVLFTMFSAPFVDLLNGLWGNVVPFGKLVRTSLVFFNMFFILLHVPAKMQKKTVVLYCIAFYLVIHSLAIELLSAGNTLIHNFYFDLKFLLFLSEMLLIMSCIERKILLADDLERFWKFNCWFVPVSLIGTNTEC